MSALTRALGRSTDFFLNDPREQSALHTSEGVKTLLRRQLRQQRDDLVDDVERRLGDWGEANALLALLADRPPSHAPPYLRAQYARYRARLDAAQGRHEGVEAGFTTAEGILAELAYPYWLARTRLDHACWLAEQGEPDRAALLAEGAADALDQLRADPQLVARARGLARPDVAVAGR